jgi:hypothetical protein
MTCDPVEYSKEVIKCLYDLFNENFYQTTLKDELKKEGTQGSKVTRPWTFEDPESSKKKGKDHKHTIIQIGIIGLSQKRDSLKNVKIAGELILYQRKPGDKKKDPNRYFVPLWEILRIVKAILPTWPSIKRVTHS